MKTLLEVHLTYKDNSSEIGRRIFVPKDSADNAKTLFISQWGTLTDDSKDFITGKQKSFSIVNPKSSEELGIVKVELIEKSYEDKILELTEKFKEDLDKLGDKSNIYLDIYKKTSINRTEIIRTIITDKDNVDKERGQLLKHYYPMLIFLDNTNSDETHFVHTDNRILKGYLVTELTHEKKVTKLVRKFKAEIDELNRFFNEEIFGRKDKK